MSRLTLRRVRAAIRGRRYAGPTVNGTRPRRALPAVAVGLASLGAMYHLVSANALAVNFTTADQTFKIYTNYLQGVSAGGFLAQNRGYSAVSQVGVAELGIKTARLAGLCAIAQQDVPGLGTVSLMIMAGVPVKGAFVQSANTTTDGANNPISLDANGQLTGASLSSAINATDLFLNTNMLNGYGNQISGLNLGQNAADTATTANLNSGTGTWPSGQTPPVAGNFGLTAQQLNVGGVDGGSYGLNLQGSINLPKLRIAVLPGSKTQADCPAQAAS